MNKYKISFAIVFFVTINIWSQKPKDTLKMETIEVVKPYQPTISDSFKISEQPQNSTDVVEKEPINYQINSVPVASTFTPDKGKAKSVTSPVKERIFENYVEFGFGNYTSPLLNSFIKAYPSRDLEVGVSLHHHSSKGGINKVDLKNAYSDSNLRGFIKKEDNVKSLKVGVDLVHGMYNYYGLSEENNYSETFLETIDPKHNFFGMALTGDINIFESFFKGGNVLLSTFQDNFNSLEQRVLIKPEIELPISSELIKVVFELDYLGGSFDKQYFGENGLKYKYLDLGIEPNFEIKRDDLSINLGFKGIYANELENSESEFKFYPNVDVSYQLLPEIVTIFASATGGLLHNTYQNRVEENPFLAPNFYSIPTDEKYKISAGLKGKIASNMGYLFSGAYSNQENTPLYMLNQNLSDGTIEVKPYQLGNSFQVVYDNAKIISLDGELTFDFSKEFTFGGNINMSFYNFENVEENWNLPSLKTNIYADYHHDKWKGVARLLMMSERKDKEIPYSISTTPEFNVVSNGTYLDLNAELYYSFTNQLSVFAKTHNILTANYKRYYNYPVQGLQILAGINYKFDF